MKPFADHVRTPSQLINALKRYRKQRDLTQAELGESSGLPQTTVSKVELNSLTPAYLPSSRSFLLSI